MSIGLFEIVTRICVAAACGAVIGVEREAGDKPAGLRTNMLVSIGAATAALATLLLADDAGSSEMGIRGADPLRIISAVVGGIGFLGAGAIIQSKGQVEGMTTAATIWVVGGLGMAAGLGYFSLAATSAVASILVLWGLGKLERSSVAPDKIRKDTTPEGDK